jgi:hypothetical protein
MKHEAIRNLYPNVVTIDDSTGVFDAQGNPVTVDEVAVAAEVARLQAAYDAKAYARKRAAEYPPIGDQLDALFHAGVFPAEMTDKIQAIKDKYPKGGA